MPEDPVLRPAHTLPTLSRNLQNRPSVSFKAFLKELKKAPAPAFSSPEGATAERGEATAGAKNISLSLSEEAEWLGYFTEKQAKAHALQAQIDKTDKEIDGMVYALYGLTAKEV